MLQKIEAEAEVACLVVLHRSLIQGSFSIVDRCAAASSPCCGGPRQVFAQHIPVNVISGQLGTGQECAHFTVHFLKLPVGYGCELALQVRDVVLSQQFVRCRGLILRKVSNGLSKKR